MHKTLAAALATVLIAAATIDAAGARPVLVELPAQMPPAASIDLKAATGQTQFGTWYCSKLQDRCDNGDANACTLYAKSCTD